LRRATKSELEGLVHAAAAASELRRLIRKRSTPAAARESFRQLIAAVDHALVEESQRILARKKPRA
jgi:hypothetical protein